MSVRSAPCFGRVCLLGPGRSGGGGLFGAHAPAQTRSHAVWTVSTWKSKIRLSHQIHLLCAAGGSGQWECKQTNPSNGCLSNVSRRARHYPFHSLGFSLAHSAWPTEYVNVPGACRAFCETAGTKLRRVSPSVSSEQLAALPVPHMEGRQAQRDVDLELCALDECLDTLLSPRRHVSLPGNSPRCRRPHVWKQCQDSLHPPGRKALLLCRP